MTSESDRSRTTESHRTAIERVGLSRPISLALADGIISSAKSVFDYGCGRGGDIRQLRARGVQASGWDPHFAPDGRLSPAAVVNLGYVLNVIEDSSERVKSLRCAFELAEEVLIVAVRIEQGIGDIPELRDGIITERGTFQKYYTQQEFIEFVQQALAARVHVPALGVAYVFKAPELEQAYVATKAFSRRLEFQQKVVERFRHDHVAVAYVQLAGRLGRLPQPEEFEAYPALLAEFGPYSRIQRLALAEVGSEAIAESGDQRRSDILVFGALLHLQGIPPPQYKSLPKPVQADIRAFWGGYAKALNEAEQFLYRIGRPELVKAACDQAVRAKKLPGNIYIHRSVEEELPPLLRVVVFAAKRIVGELSYDVAKIATDGRSVSFLSYPGFDEIGHPKLTRSIRVYLPKATVELRDYSGASNPPILHRKDALVAPTYPQFASFRELTIQEEGLGLLSSPDIGTSANWEALLSPRGLRIEGHNLVRV